MDSTTIESKVVEFIKQVAEEKTLQEMNEMLADLDAKQSKRDEELNGLLSKLDDQIKAEKAAAREKERKEAIDKAAQEFDSKYRHEGLDQHWLSMFNS